MLSLRALIRSWFVWPQGDVHGTAWQRPNQFAVWLRRHLRRRPPQERRCDASGFDDRLSAVGAGPWGVVALAGQRFLEADIAMLLLLFRNALLAPGFAPALASTSDLVFKLAVFHSSQLTMGLGCVHSSARIDCRERLCAC